MIFAMKFKNMIKTNLVFMNATEQNTSKKYKKYKTYKNISNSKKFFLFILSSLKLYFFIIIKSLPMFRYFEKQRKMSRINFFFDYILSISNIKRI